MVFIPRFREYVCCWQVVNHFHFGIACTYSTKLGQHPRDFRLINIVKALLLQLIDDFAHCAQLAREAGYDGVEVMEIGRAHSELQSLG